MERELGTAITERLRWGAEGLRPGLSVCVHGEMWTRLPAGLLTAPAHVRADSGHLLSNRNEPTTATHNSCQSERDVAGKKQIRKI